MTRLLLLETIEDLRSSLVLLASKHEFNLQHPEVIRISQELDKYITQYTYLVNAID